MPRTTTADSMLTIPELADQLNVNTHVIYRWRRQGLGPVGYRFGNSVRYKQSDVDKWLAQQRDTRAAS